MIIKVFNLVQFFKKIKIIIFINGDIIHFIWSIKNTIKFSQNSFEYKILKLKQIMHHSIFRSKIFIDENLLDLMEND